MKITFISFIAFLMTGCTATVENYSIRATGGGWRIENVRLPETDRYQLSKAVPIPHLYQLEREEYLVSVEVNPNGYGHQIILQISITSKLPLTVESAWEGDCGRVGALADLEQRFISVWQEVYFTKPEFTKPGSVGFIWNPGAGFCAPNADESPETASSFPIMLKIYNESTLVGEERIDFEIFQNGYNSWTDYP